jgi:hypothetical protein
LQRRYIQTLKEELSKSDAKRFVDEFYDALLASRYYSTWTVSTDYSNLKDDFPYLKWYINKVTMGKAVPSPPSFDFNWEAYKRFESAFPPAGDNDSARKMADLLKYIMSIVNDKGESKYTVEEILNGVPQPTVSAPRQERRPAPPQERRQSFSQQTSSSFQLPPPPFSDLPENGDITLIPK